MMPFDKVSERYRNDVVFHAIVDTLQAAIERLELTPSEVREAAMYACSLVEMRRGFRPFVLKIDPSVPPDTLQIEQDGRIIGVVPLSGKEPYR